MPRRLLVRVGFLLLLAGPWAALPASGEWLEVRKILGADTAANDTFGEAMVLDGDRLAVGVPRDDSPLADAGSVYLFERNQGGPERWGQVAKLTASDAGSSWHLGAAVALHGDTVASAARADGEGAVYIFERQADGQWAETAKISRPPLGPNDTFADSVAIEGDTLFVGSSYYYIEWPVGAVWVYKRHAAGPPRWRLVARLTAENPMPPARFGWTSAVEDGILAVGDPADPEIGSEAGAVHVFEQDGSGAWVVVAKLMASDGVYADRLGHSVAVSGSTVVAGAPGSGTAGAAYVFERDETGAWAEAAKLTASDAGVGDYFGGSVAISGDLVVVGAEHAEDQWASSWGAPWGAPYGAAYLFQRQADGSWVEIAKLKASDGAYLDNFGQSVAAGPATTIVGAVYDDEAGFYSGSAYVFLEREVGLSLAGVCPGEVMLTITGATPLAPAAVLHGEEGMSEVPGGPCAGTQLGLANPRLAGVALTDLTGGLTVTRVLESPACDRFVQALDLATCAVSGVAALP
jgi:FG-GAP repeat